MKPITINGKYTLLSQCSQENISPHEAITFYKAKKEPQQEPTLLVKQIPKSAHIEERLVQQEHKNIKLATQLNHPNLLKLIDYIEDSSSYYFVYPDCNKGNLAELLKKNEIKNEAEALDYFRQLCCGLKALHDSKIMLKGIRFEDILIHETKGANQLIISDYGLANTFDENPNFYRSIKVLSTRAPEIYTGVHGYEADIYSLGCILYKLITGKDFLSGPSEADVVELQKHYKSTLIDCMWKISELTLILLEGCLQYKLESRITMAELTSLLALDTFYSNYAPLDLDVKCTITIINCSKRETRSAKKAKEVQLLKDFNSTPVFPSQPIDEINKKEQEWYEARIEEDAKMRMQINNLRDLCESLKLKLEKCESENNHKISMEKYEVLGLKKELIELQNKEIAAESAKLHHKLSEMQEINNTRLNKFEDSLQKVSSKSENDKSASLIDLQKLQSQFNQLNEICNIKFKEIINTSRTDIADLKSNINSIQLSSHNSYKTEIGEIKNSLASYINAQAATIAKLQTEIISIKEGYTKYYDLFKNDLISLGQQKAEKSQFNKVTEQLQTQFTKLQDDFNKRYENTISDIKRSVSNDVEKYKTEIIQIKKTISNNDTIPTEILKLNTELARLQETTSKLFNSNKEDINQLQSKNKQLESDTAKNKTDLTEVKKLTTAIKFESYGIEINKLYSIFAAHQEKINQSIESLHADIIKLNSEVPLLKESPRQISFQEKDIHMEESKSIRCKRVSTSRTDSSDLKKFIDNAKAKFLEYDTLIAQTPNKALSIPKETKIFTDIIEMQAEVSKLYNEMQQITELAKQQNISHGKEFKLTCEQIEKVKGEVKSNSAELSKLNASIININDSISKKKQTQNIKSVDTNNAISTTVFHTEVNRLQSQINQIIENQQHIIELRNTQQNSDSIGKMMMDIGQLKELYASANINVINESIAKLQEQLQQTKENKEQSLASQLSNYNEAIADIKKSIATLQAAIKEHDNSQNHVSQINECIPQKALNNKITEQATEDTKQQISEIQNKLNTLKEEITKSNQQATQINELTKIVKSEVNICINSEIEKSRKEIEAKISVISSSTAKQYTDYDAKHNADIENVKSTMQNTTTAIANSNTSEIAKIYTLINNYKEEINKKLQESEQNDMGTKAIQESIASKDDDINQIKSKLYQLQEGFNERIVLIVNQTKLQADSYDKLKAQVESIYSQLQQQYRAINEQIKLIQNEIAHSNNSTEVSKLQSQIYLLHETLNTKLEKSNDSAKQNEEPINSQSIMAQLSSLQENVELLNTLYTKLEAELPPLHGNIKANIQNPKIPEIQVPPKEGTKLYASAYSNLSIQSPRKDEAPRMFKTVEGISMKIEQNGSKYIVTDNDGNVKDEFDTSEIATLKLDDVNKSVIVTRKSVNSSPEKPTTTQLMSNSLPDAVGIYKLLRNNHLMKSDKKPINQ